MPRLRELAARYARCTFTQRDSHYRTKRKGSSGHWIACTESSRRASPYTIQCTCSPIHNPRGYKGCDHRHPWKGGMAMGQAVNQLTRKQTRSTHSHSTKRWLAASQLLGSGPMPSGPWAHPAQGPGARHVPVMCGAHNCATLRTTRAPVPSARCSNIRATTLLEVEVPCRDCKGGSPDGRPCRSSRPRRRRRAWQLRHSTKVERVRAQQAIGLACNAPCDYGGHEVQECGAQHMAACQAALSATA